ncbi:MAG: CheR family methyltransferase [Ilumatobacter sp.]
MDAENMTEASNGEASDVVVSPRLVIGIGASAGGLEALEYFFDDLPKEKTGFAFVVVQHLAPDFKSLMDELIRRHTSLPVHVAENDQLLLPDSISLIPPNFDMIMSGGRLLLSERDNTETLNLPIDRFFKSMATDLGDRAVAVVLSGTGSDGSRGVVAVHEAGGRVVVQDPLTAAFDGMPNSTIATGVADVRLPPSDMPGYLTRAAGLSHIAVDAPESPDESAVYQPVFELLSEHHHVDFNQYKLGTIARRIERRLRLAGSSSVSDYLSLLYEEPEQITVLYHDLLIGVTEFFRDEAAWARLAEIVIPELFDTVEPGEEIRCWVAGTASGQEAYTLAILLQEAADERNVPLRARIFATDLHQASIDTASQGVYPVESVEHLSDERRTNYFTERDSDNVQISTDTRKLVVFAQHNLISDPPFTKLDLITCRNVLIYFQPQAQLRALTRFQFGLRRGGTLFLGSSESIGELDTEFETLDRRQKIFVKQHDRSISLGLRELRNPTTPARRDAIPGLSDQVQLMRAYDELLQKYAPPSLLVNASGLLLHAFGAASSYFKPISGRTTIDVTELVFDELRLPLISGLQRLQRERKNLSYHGVRISQSGDDDDIAVDVHLAPVSGSGGSATVLITLEESEASKRTVDTTSTPVDPLEWNQAVPAHLKELEAELRFAQENLQTTVEELETTNEELQATNEELAASNEELQSSNEELHSVNEELYTVNKEYESKIEELTQLTDDVENLLESTRIGTIFLDRNLRIRKFTPAAADEFNLLAQDIGRPISHLSHNIEVDGFSDLLHQVLDTGRPLEFEAEHNNGQWYLMRLHPYFAQRIVQGVVITLIDIGTLKHVSASLARSNADLRSFAYGVSHDMQEPVRVITNLGDVLVSRLAGEADGDTELTFLLDQVKTASDRLRAMLDAMLMFSRVDTRGGEFERCSLNDTVGEILRRREAELDAAHASIEVGDLPTVVGETVQLSWLFGELITNSLKFRSDSAVRISISATTHNNEMVRVTVSDNGTGIPIGQRHAVFDLFKRLRERGDAPGVGAGLTIARRIVDHHGGEIYVDGPIEGGAAISFILPLVGHVPSEPTEVTS